MPEIPIADGKKIAFYLQEDEKSGALYVMDADGGKRQTLLQNESQSRGAARMAAVIPLFLGR